MRTSLNNTNFTKLFTTKTLYLIYNVIRTLKQIIQNKTLHTIQSEIIENDLKEFTVALKDNGAVLNIPPIITPLPKPGLSPLPPPPLTQQELETFKSPPSPYGLAILLVDFSSIFNAIITDLQ